MPKDCDWPFNSLALATDLGTPSKWEGWLAGGASRPVCHLSPRHILSAEYVQRGPWSALRVGTLLGLGRGRRARLFSSPNSIASTWVPSGPGQLPGNRRGPLIVVVPLR